MLGGEFPVLPTPIIIPTCQVMKEKKMIKCNLKQLKMVSLTIERLFAERNKVRWSKMPFSAWATSSPIGNMTIIGDI